MKTTIKTNEVPFSKLKIGDTYIDKDFDEDEIFMVVEPSLDVMLLPDKEIVGDTEFCGYGVSLTTGAIYGYPESELVIPVRAEVTGYIQ
jgi:hypothetical protein